MLSLRQSLALIGQEPPLGVRGVLPCKSLRDSLIAWNHIPYRLLIIAPQEFVEALNPLVDHKNNTGMATLIRSLEHIYMAYPGRDEAEQVKRCLALFQPNNGVRYAMLVGDQNVFPVRYIKSLDPPKPDSAFIPSDLYYASLFKQDGSFDDWDANQDGYFGEVPCGDSTGPVNPDHVHGIPDLAIGRVPASKVDYVNIYVSKVKSYELSAFGAAWAKSALFIATTDWEVNACKILEDVSLKYLQSFDSMATETYKPTVYKLYAEGNPCQATDHLNWVAINHHINGGVGFVAYVGHGNLNFWATPNGGYTVNEVAKLNNPTMLPVVFAAACLTGEFTALAPRDAYRDVNGNYHKGTLAHEVFPATAPQPACLQDSDCSTTMAEQMTVMLNAGAVAYAGSTVVSASDTELLGPFFETATVSETLGDMWLHMLQVYYQKHIPPDPDTPMNIMGYDAYGQYINPWFFNLFGDPSLRIQGTSSPD